MEVLHHKNEKKAMKRPAACSRGCPVWHMAARPLRLGRLFPHWLQVHLLLTLFAGYALCDETTAAASMLISTAQSEKGQEMYFLNITVDVTGQKKDELDIVNWLRPVFETNLQTCVSASTISTTTDAATTTPALNSTLQSTSTALSTTLQVNTSTTNTTQSNPITTATNITTPTTPSTTAPSPSSSTIPTTTLESTGTTADTTTSQSPSTMSGLTTALQTTAAITTIALHTSLVTTATEEVTPDKQKPSNSPNPNSERSISRNARSSAVTTGLLQGFEVACLQKTEIKNTECYVTLILKQRVKPCCILSTFCAASKNSSNIFVSGKQINTVVPLPKSDTNTECSDSLEDSCVYTGPRGQTCDETESAYVASTNDSTQCGAENKCNCSAYCSKTEAFYTFNMSTTDPKITASYLATMMSGLTKPPECPSGSVCPSSYTNIASKYKSASVSCRKASTLLSCTMALRFSEAVPICDVSEVVTTVLQSQNISMNGPVTRAAICGNPEGIETPLISTFTMVEVDLKPGNFCKAIKESHPFSCQKEERVVAMLDEQCVWLPTTISPNVTTVQPNTTLSANETMNTTASFNATSTPGNESTTAAPTTTADSSLAMAGALLEMSKDASKLNSSQVDQLVSQLEKLLSGPNVSMPLGTISVEIVSNLQNASLQAVDNSKNRIMGIVDTVGEKLVLSESTVSVLSEAVALSVKQADGTNFKETYFSISDPNNVQVGVPKVRRAVDKGSSVPQGSIRLPRSLTENLTSEEQQLVSRVQFNFYQKSTLFQDKSLGNKTLISGIIGASVANLSISDLQDDIIIQLRNTQPIAENDSATCVFWDFTMNNGSGGWNGNGCKVRNITNNETICGCNHLTSFGILLDISRQPLTNREQATILTFITYIGCGISAIFLAVTLLTYLAFGKLRKDIPSKILIQLCLSLLLLNLVFLVDAWLALYPNAVGLCISTAWFLHYFLLVTFTWMGLEAVHMYIALVKVFNSHISRYMVKFSFAGWGIPMIVVIIVIAIDKDNYGLVSYGKFPDGTTDEFCWIKNDTAFYVAVVAYFCVIFLFNLIMFIVVLVQLCRIKRQNPHNLQHRTTLQDVRSVMGITILLGLTWGFAFFAWDKLNLPFMYLFAIFNTLQGFFIFIFHCAVKENVRRQWRTYLCCGKMRLAENSEWSRTATQKTTKKSSVTRVTSLQSSKSSRSNNSSSSSSFLVNDTLEQINGTGSPFDDRTITADEDPSMDVVLNELNSQYRRL